MKFRVYDTPFKQYSKSNQWAIDQNGVVYYGNAVFDEYPLVIEEFIDVVNLHVGDIVEYEGWNYSVIKAYAGYQLLNHSFQTTIYFNTNHKYTAIGNINENPELLQDHPCLKNLQTPFSDLKISMFEFIIAFKSQHKELPVSIIASSEIIDAVRFLNQSSGLFKIPHDRMEFKGIPIIEVEGVGILRFKGATNEI